MNDYNGKNPMQALALGLAAFGDRAPYDRVDLADAIDRVEPDAAQAGVRLSPKKLTAKRLRDAVREARDRAKGRDGSPRHSAEPVVISRAADLIEGLLPRSERDETASSSVYLG